MQRTSNIWNKSGLACSVWKLGTHSWPHWMPIWAASWLVLAMMCFITIKRQRTYRFSFTFSSLEGLIRLHWSDQCRRRCRRWSEVEIFLVFIGIGSKETKKICCTIFDDWINTNFLCFKHIVDPSCLKTLLTTLIPEHVLSMELEHQTFFGFMTHILVRVETIIAL